MTITSLPATAPAAADFADIAAFLAASPEAERLLKGRRIIHIPLEGGEPDERLAHLYEIAQAFGTEVEWCGPGYFQTARHFGGITFAATYTPGQVLAASDVWSSVADGGLAVARREPAA